MNPDAPLSPREALEVRLTALLFGEVPPDEAQALRAQLDADPELAALHARLQQAVALLREARGEDSTHAPAHLAPERRERLLAHFKTVAAPIAVARPRRDWSWVAPLGLAAALIALIGGSVSMNPSVQKKSARVGEHDFASNHDWLMDAEGKDVRRGSQPKRFLAFRGGDARARLEGEKAAPTGTGSRDLQTVLRSEDRNQSVELAIDPQPQPVLAMTKSGAGTLTILPAQTAPLPTSPAPAPPASPIAGSSISSGNAAPGGASGLADSRPPMLGEIPGPRTFFDNQVAPAAWPEVTSFATGKVDTGRWALNASDAYSSATTITDAKPLSAGSGRLTIAVGSTRTLEDPEKSLAEVSKTYLYAKSSPDAGTDPLGSVAVEQRMKGSEALVKQARGEVARGLRETANQAKDDFDIAGVEEVRLRALKEVDRAWVRPIRKINPPTEANARASDDAAMQFTELAEPKLKKSSEVAAIAGEPVEFAKLKSAELPKVMQKVEAEEEVLAKMHSLPAAVPQPEIQTSVNAFSTFSLNVTDVSFKLAAASLEKGQMPDAATVRSEEFINAFDYRDPEPAAGAPLAFASERARYPFAQNRDLLRLSAKTAAAGRAPGRALNVVLLLDNSGSMERADRVNIVREALRVLASQLHAEDKLSVITFARTPRLWIDGCAGDKAGEATARVGEITPQGGTNLEAALDLGYATAKRHFQVGSINRVVLLTDGAANLGDVNPAALKAKVEAQRKQGIALDAFGVGWEGFDDSMLEALSRNGDGRYGFINTPEAAATEFAAQLAGALRVAASDVKVQVEFNPRRVTAYRQIGYAKHQLTKEQFRDNTVDAAEIGAAESGNALYAIEVNPRGEGDIATVRVRFKVPGTSDYREHEWTVPFSKDAPPLDQASPALRLAGTASAFSEMLAGSPFAAEVTSDALLGLINGVPAIFGIDPRPQKLEWMIRQAKSISGK